MKQASVILTWDQIAEGLEISIPVCVVEEDMRQFALLSGDLNPLHTDQAFARRKGFEKRVVYGALLVAYVSRLVGMHLPGQDSVLASIDVKFRNPLFVEEAAALHAEVRRKHNAVRLLEIGFRVFTEVKTVAEGTVQVLVR